MYRSNQTLSIQPFYILTSMVNNIMSLLYHNNIKQFSCNQNKILNSYKNGMIYMESNICNINKNFCKDLEMLKDIKLKTISLARLYF